MTLLKKTFTKTFQNTKNTIFRSAVVIMAALAANTARTAAASAATFFFTEAGSDVVSRVEDLEVDGKFYDVDFLMGSREQVFPDEIFDFLDRDSATAAAEALMGALGDSLKTSFWGDVFYLPFLSSDTFGYWVVMDKSRYEDEDVIDVRTNGLGVTNYPIAKFTPAESGGDVVATPEPSLIVGFITLGGLMLGSKGKTKD